MKKFLSAVLVCVLLVGCVFALASCGATPNEDPAEAKKALEAAKYEVYFTDDADDLKYMAPFAGIKAALSAYIMENDDDVKSAVSIYYFNDDADMDKAYEAIEKVFNEGKDETPDLKLEIGKSGNMIWFGTADAIKAAK